MRENGNCGGCVQCPLLENWPQHKAQLKDAMRKLDGLDTIMPQLLANAAHLEKLSALEAIRDKLLDSATGRRQMDVETVQQLVRIMGIVIIGLLLVIVFLLTGQHFGLVSLK